MARSGRGGLRLRAHSLQATGVAGRLQHGRPRRRSARGGGVRAEVVEPEGGRLRRDHFRHRHDASLVLAPDTDLPVRRGALRAGLVYAYKLIKGHYKYVSQKLFMASNTGAYSASFKLKKGTYKFRTYYGGNTAASLNPAVISGYSKKSVVK